MCQAHIMSSHVRLQFGNFLTICLNIRFIYNMCCWMLHVVYRDRCWMPLMNKNLSIIYDVYECEWQNVFQCTRRRVKIIRLHFRWANARSENHPVGTAHASLTNISNSYNVRRVGRFPLVLEVFRIWRKELLFDCVQKMM